MHKIMLVEDDETMLSLLETFLIMEGFEVIKEDCENTLETIIENVRRSRPELVISDITLRQLDGFQLLAKIKQNSELQGVRVLMSSGIDHSQRCYQAGADGFLLKPYMPEELVDKIGSILK